MYFGVNCKALIGQYFSEVLHCQQNAFFFSSDQEEFFFQQRLSPENTDTLTAHTGEETETEGADRWLTWPLCNANRCESV